MSGHVERLEAFLGHWDATDYLTEMTDIAGAFDGAPALTTVDLRAALDELERLRAEREAADEPTEYRRWLIRNLGAAYSAGWEAHADLVSGTLATLGSGKREQCGRAWVADRLADLTEDADSAPQQPEHPEEKP